MSQSVDDPLLDHSYDGIQEFDNPLPGWWKMLFWGTIVFCIPYTYFYHFGPGDSIHEKFEKDMAKFSLSLNLSEDAETILALRNDEEKLDLVRTKFTALCAACHNPQGSGVANLGPNLTDQHWKNVQTLPDIARVLRDGVPGTAMVSQVANLNDDERILMAAYVASLSLNPVEGLPPEGEEILAWPVEAAEATPTEEPGDNTDANEPDVDQTDPDDKQ